MLRLYAPVTAVTLALALAVAGRGSGEPLPKADAEAQVRPVAQQPGGTGDPVRPAEIWPASLERIAGRYVFLQVASPGGLWESSPNGRRQVSVSQLTPEMQRRLSGAEIVISDLKLPSMVTASERTSPSGRGKLRRYDESATGRLVYKNLPGIAGDGADSGDFSGAVIFSVEHQSHSNPSVNGVLSQRVNQEMTWGAATLDYADLNATPMREKPAAEKPNPPVEDEEERTVMTNARILRSGVEIFAFVTWTEMGADGPRTYTGSVRLAKQGSRQPVPGKPDAGRA